MDDNGVIVLESLLKEAIDGLIWCSGSPSFAPDGEARVGWEKGPQVVIAQGLTLLADRYQETGLGPKLGG